ncbi:hypothetical protein QR680_013755 [Steinernema hermaphroditum]|uniref:Uncharacterized protein n=1 Tax=Steinernema hermaphroditum TaxID=289476 RepID=A0AA39I9B8_9BILA|nr:hypothetical protein QR680_013755 [Steinernema hermaphroditum]
MMKKKGSYTVDSLEEVELNAYLDLLPEEIKDFYRETSEADLSLLHGLREQLKGKNEQESFRIIKAAHAPLAERLKTMYTKLFQKINKLSEKPKTYLTNLIRRIEDIDAESLEDWLAKVDKVAVTLGKPDQASQNEILTTFPTLDGFWDDM